MAQDVPSTEVLVCVKCRKGAEIPEGDTRPGAVLFEALSQLDLPDGVSVRAVECLSNCSHGCTVALRGPGRWSYVYGRLDEATQASTVAEGAAAYHATQDGLVAWRERPEHFRKNCIARIPPLEI